jgi:ArsR family transcriptional regulator
MPPTPESDLLPRAQPIEMTVALEPAANIINSVLLLSSADTLSGLDEWVVRTAVRLTPEQLHRNRLVLEGMYHAVLPERRWPSFAAYLGDLAASKPEVLRDRLMWHITHSSKQAPPAPGAAPRQLADPQELLVSAEAYINYLRTHFWEFDEAIEVEAHAYFNDPPAMQTLIVGHLREMWQAFLAPEWERVQPLLQESVSAFQQVDFTQMALPAAFRAVTGQDLNEKWEHLIVNASQMIFVPSAHIGPYLRAFKGGRLVWVLFGARLPEGAPAGQSALGRSELLVRLGALNDDTRLRILALLSQHDELCAQDIMTLLDLTQSAASRHLRQLSATGYVTERRREIAKCYSLNRERVGDTFRALERFLSHS